MESSLRMSEFGEDSNILEQSDEEIESLQKQVSEAESTLLSLTTAATRQRAEYAQTLSTLMKDIETAKNVAAEALARQKAENTEALESLKTRLDREMMDLESQIKNCELQNSLFEQTHQEIHLLSEMTKVHDLERKAEEQKARVEEVNAISAVSQLQKSMGSRDRRNAAILAVKKLEQEISELQATRRELHAVLRLKSGDLIAQMDIKQRDQATFIGNLRRTMNERDARYATHINAVKAQIEKERIDMANDMKMTADKVDNLQKVYQAVSRNGNKQLGLLERDIEKMRRLVEAAGKAEERHDITHLEQIHKLERLNTETALLRTKSQEIEQQLLQTKARNGEAVTNLRKSEKKTYGRHHRTSVFS